MQIKPKRSQQSLMINKKELSELDICDLYITPVIKNAGWDPYKQMRRDVTLTPGPVIVRGELSARNKKKKKFADYILSWEPGTMIAVVEAKDNNYTVSHGMAVGQMPRGISNQNHHNLFQQALPSFPIPHHVLRARQ